LNSSADDENSIFEDADEDFEDNIIASQRPENVCKIDEFVIIQKYREQSRNGFIENSSDESDNEEPKIVPEYKNEPIINDDQIRKRDIKFLQKEKLKYKEEENKNIMKNQNWKPQVNMQVQQGTMPIINNNSLRMNYQSNAQRERLPSLSNTLNINNRNGLPPSTNDNFKLPGINKVNVNPMNEMSTATINTEQPINMHFNPFKKVYLNPIMPGNYGAQILYTARPINVWPQLQNNSYENYVIPQNKLILKATSSHQIIQIPVHLLSIQGQPQYRMNMK